MDYNCLNPHLSQDGLDELICFSLSLPVSSRLTLYLSLSYSLLLGALGEQFLSQSTPVFL